MQKMMVVLWCAKMTVAGFCAKNDGSIRCVKMTVAG